MEIRTLHYLEGARDARGIAVVIDVFRAFSTACCLAAGSPTAIIPVADLSEAYELKRHNPQWVLAGERGGRIQEGFDYGNSPSAVSGKDFTGKTVVLTTSAGTQGLAASYRHADEVVTGSFMNAAATAQWILQRKPETVSLVCMGWNSCEPADEDTSYAAYLESLLIGRPLPFSPIAHFLKNESTTKSFRHTHDDPGAMRSDLNLCLSLDKFSFALKYTEDPRPGLVPVHPVSA